MEQARTARERLETGKWLEALPPCAAHTVRLLQAWKVPAWLVGGAVRDLLLGRPAYDFDFALQGDALAVARRVANALQQPFVALDADRRFGRVVVAQELRDPVFLDFTELVNGSLEEDLAQRDFTVNALAIDLSGATGALVDRFSGFWDLWAGCIRAVSRDVFKSDPLRMLRAVRFRAELGFFLEPDTERLVARQARLLKKVAWERIRDEMCRILASQEAGAHLTYLHDLGLLAPISPELAALAGVEQSEPHWQDVLSHSFQVVTELEAVLACAGLRNRPGAWPGQAPPFAYARLAECLRPFLLQLQVHLCSTTGFGRSRALLLKWAALLHDVGKPLIQTREPNGRIRFLGHDAKGAPLAAEVATRLRFNRREVEALRLVVQHHMRPSLLAAEPKVTRRATYRFFRDLGQEGVNVVLLALADHLATWGSGLQAERWERRLDVSRQLLEGYYHQRAQVVEPPRWVTGHDLLRLGVGQGPQIGHLLEAIREAQVEGLVTSKEEALAWARQRLAQEDALHGDAAGDGMG